jgi:hypothetical protein
MTDGQKAPYVKKQETAKAKVRCRPPRGPLFSDRLTLPSAPWCRCSTWLRRPRTRRASRRRPRADRSSRPLLVVLAAPVVVNLCLCLPSKRSTIVLYCVCVCARARGAMLPEPVKQFAARIDRAGPFRVAPCCPLVCLVLPGVPTPPGLRVCARGEASRPSPNNNNNRTSYHRRPQIRVL